jgi:hypothetical protein
VVVGESYDITLCVRHSCIARCRNPWTRLTNNSKPGSPVDETGQLIETGNLAAVVYEQYLVDGVIEIAHRIERFREFVNAAHRIGGLMVCNLDHHRPHVRVGVRLAGKSPRPDTIATDETVQTPSSTVERSGY